MIVGEEVWINQLRTEKEYDEFFRKIRKAVKNTAKKVQPLKILKPAIKSSPLGLAGQLLKPKSSSQYSNPTLVNSVVPQKAVQVDSLRKKTVEEDRKELLEEIKQHEEQKLQDARALEEKEASLIQAQIDADYGNNKQLVSTGMIAIVAFIGLVAVIVYVKSKNHKNQLEAMRLELASKGSITK